MFKLNNGLIIQFGYHNNNNNVPLVNLPISYKQKHFTCLVTIGVRSEGGCSAYNLELTNFSTVANSGNPKRWLSLGI